MNNDTENSEQKHNNKLQQGNKYSYQFFTKLASITMGLSQNLVIKNHFSESEKLVLKTTLLQEKTEKAALHNQSNQPTLIHHHLMPHQAYSTQFSLDHSPEGILWVDPSGTIIYSNNAASRVLGYSPAELLSMNVLDIDLDIPPEMWDKYWNTTKKRHCLTFESRHRRKDGSAFTVNITASYFHMDDIEYMCLLTHNISEHNQAEAMLKASEIRYRTLIEDQTELICRFQPDGILTFVNNACCRYFGKPYYELIGQNFFSLIPDSEQDIIQRHFSLCFKDPVTIYEHQIVNALDETCWLQWTEQAIFNKAGYLIEFQSVGRDITELRRTEAKLRIAQFSLDRSADAVYWIDSDGKLLYVNDAACAMSGYTRKEFLTRNIRDIDSNISNTTWQNFWNQCAQKGSFTTETQHQRKDGTTFPVEITTNYLEYDGKEYLCSFGRDITERKQMDKQLCSYIKELEQHTLEMTLLNGMSEFLQSCPTINHAYKIIAQSASQIFVGQSGALYLFNPSDTLLEAVTTWGDPSLTEHELSPELCWALQRRRVHIFTESSDIPCCQHQETPSETNNPCLSICVPLITQGEPLGVFYLRNNISLTQPEREHWRWLTVTVASQSALALANLQLREQLHSQSIRDPLTGLFNRRFLKDMLERELRKATRNHSSIGIIMLDIDHFKCFNDNYGHDGGDALLRAMGSLLQKHIQGKEIACRYGGEEFILILPETSLFTTIKRARDLCTSIRYLSVQHEGQQLGPVTASIGVSSFPEHGSTTETVVSMADQSLYQAKNSGRNRVIVAEPL